MTDINWLKIEKVEYPPFYDILSANPFWTGQIQKGLTLRSINQYILSRSYKMNYKVLKITNDQNGYLAALNSNIMKKKASSLPASEALTPITLPRE